MVKTDAPLGEKTETKLTFLKEAVRNIPDFPKPGILFRDITPLLGNPKLFKTTIELMAAPFKKARVDYIVGIEARGFVLASAMVHVLNAGFVPVRKKGKLPYKVVSASYNLEYAQDTLEIHEDAFSPGSNVLIVDDVLATGGTAKASIELVEKIGGKVLGVAFLIELLALKGREKINNYPLYSLIQF